MFQANFSTVIFLIDKQKTNGMLFLGAGASKPMNIDDLSGITLKVIESVNPKDTHYNPKDTPKISVSTLEMQHKIIEESNVPRYVKKEITRFFSSFL